MESKYICVQSVLSQVRQICSITRENGNDELRGQKRKLQYNVVNEVTKSLKK